MKGRNYQWYILSIRGGREEKVIEKIKSELEKKGWSNYLQEFKVVSDDQKKNILKRYILCRCHLNSEITRFFYQIPEVVGFLNHQRNDDQLPGPVSEAVVKNFLTKVEEVKETKPINKEINLKTNDLVKITKGEFVDQEGRVVQINEKTQKVKIIVESSGWEISDVPISICEKVIG